MTEYEWDVQYDIGGACGRRIIYAASLAQAFEEVLSDEDATWATAAQITIKRTQ